MPTGAEYARIPNKRLLSAEDFRDRILGYLRTLMLATNKAQWSVDGVFDTKLTLTGGVDTVIVNGTSIATDGLGHLFDVSQIFSPSSLFENANAITYYVGFKYAEAPTGIIVNPRTGEPEYIATKELIGESAAPTSVTDNGNGTITFNVNSVTEAGVSNAGRTVRVFKVVPASDALSTVIAIEDRVVAFGSGNNTITTVGDLGQSVISTTAADYVVVLLGASVKRNTNTESTSGYFHIGTVVGAGSGNTPSTFDISLQRLLKSFDDASQTTFTPYLWIDSTNVQDAIQELVDGLLDDGATDPGASRIGVDGTAFDPIVNFGIGNIADGTLTDPVGLQEVLVAIDNSVQRRKAWKTINDNNGSSALADAQGVALSSQLSSGGQLYLRALANAAGAPYTIATSPTSGGYGSHVLGETSDPSNASAHLRRLRMLISSAVTLTGGKWERVYLDAVGGDGVTLGGVSQGQYGMELNDFGMNGGNFRVSRKGLEDDPPIRLRHGVIRPKAEATKAYSSSLRLGAGSSGNMHGIFEGLIIYGPDVAQTSPATAQGALHVSGDLVGTPIGTTAATHPRPLVYRDCVFIQQRTDTPLIVTGSDHKIVFENCHFFGIAGYSGTDPLIKLGQNSVVVFRDCLFFDPEGHTLVAPNVDGLFENCVFVCGLGGSATVTSPQIIKATANTTYNHGLTFKNTTVIIGSSAIRTTGSPPNMLEFGSSTSTDLKVDGLRIRIVSGTNLPASPLLQLNGSNGSGGQAIYEDIAIGCGGLALPAANTIGLVATESGSPNQRTCKIQNIKIWGMLNPTGDLASSIIYLDGYCDVNGVHIQVPSGTAGRLNTYLYCNQGHMNVASVHFDNTSTMRLIKAPIWIGQNANAVKANISHVTRNVNELWQFGGTDPSAAVIFCEGDKWDLSGVHVDMSAQNSIKMIVIDGSGNTLRNSELSSGSGSVPLVHCVSGRRRNKLMENNVSWDGSSAAAFLIDSDSSLADNNIFLRTGGSQEPIDNTGDGGVVGSNNILDDVA